MFERELAPSIFVVTFCISVGAYYLLSVFMTVALLLGSAYLFWAYKS